jgi:hypothetical protein
MAGEARKRVRPVGPLKSTVGPTGTIPVGFTHV